MVYVEILLFIANAYFVVHGVNSNEDYFLVIMNTIAATLMFSTLTHRVVRWYVKHYY